jgi:hypothetical protein
VPQDWLCPVGIIATASAVPVLGDDLPGVVG